MILPGPQHLYSDRLPASPVALTSLQHLKAVCWHGHEHPCWDTHPPLPGGPWLGRLRRLAMPAPVLGLADSLAALSEAQQLQQLAVSGTHYIVTLGTRGRNGRLFRQLKPRNDEVQSIIAWAAGHSSLRLLALESKYLSKTMASAAATAQQQRPGLQTQHLFLPACRCD